MTEIITPICWWCERHQPGEGRPTCTAFPDGIPDEILTSASDHRLPFPGDGGIQFMQDPTLGGGPPWSFYPFESPEPVTGAVDWSPDLHPRGRDGKFIDKFGWVSFDWLDRLGHRDRFHGQVESIVPDPHRPGSPAVTVRVLNNGRSTRYVLRPHDLDSIDVKARFGLQLGHEVGPTHDPLNPLTSVEERAGASVPSVRFRGDFSTENRRQVDASIEAIQKRWPNAPLVEALNQAAKKRAFGRKSDATRLPDSGFHGDEFLEDPARQTDGQLIDPSKRGLVAHEFGHIMHTALEEDDRTLTHQLNRILSEHRMGDKMGGSPSPNGNENEYEFVAEALADVMKNGDAANPDSKRVAAIFDTAYGPNGRSVDSLPYRRRRVLAEDQTTRDLNNYEVQQLDAADFAKARANTELSPAERQALDQENQRRLSVQHEQINKEIFNTPTSELKNIAADRPSAPGYAAAQDTHDYLVVSAGDELARRARERHQDEALRKDLIAKINAQTATLSTTDANLRYSQLDEVLSPYAKGDTVLGTDSIYDKIFPPENNGGAWTPERAAVHEQMWQTLLQQVEAANIPKDRDALVLGGLPGAGKTFSLKPGQAAEDFGIVTWDPSEPIPEGGATHVSINPDTVKQLMVQAGLTVPGLNPTLKPMEEATFLHEESSVVSKMFQSRLSDLGYNVVLDNTLHSAPKMSVSMSTLAQENYSFRGLFADITPDESKVSAKSRYLDSAFTELGGRFVPSSLVGDSTSTKGSMSKNRDAFDELVARDWFTDWKVVDNTGISETPRNPRKVVTAEGHGNGSEAQRIFNETQVEDSALKQARIESTSDAWVKKEKRRKSLWERAFGRRDEARLSDPAVHDLRQMTQTEGGFTYDPRQDAFPKTGFSVATADRGQVFNNRHGQMVHPTPEELQSYVHEHWKDLQDNKNLYVGAWLDDTTGQVWLDIPEVLGSRDQALSDARRRGELAIFDLSTLSEVRVPYSTRPPSGPAHDAWGTDSVLVVPPEQLLTTTGVP